MINESTVSLTSEQVVDHANRILAEVEKAIVGKHDVLQHLLAAFLASGGHILIEDYPGLAKTLIANSFASALGLQFKRVQFTPDLLPSDITGGYIFDNRQNGFALHKGPIFTNILLADEVNRALAEDSQSALLEAMQEYQVTLEGDTIPLPDPFIVVATQNPIEYEGTFPLPEAQLDRFIVKLRIGYPAAEEEQEILERRRLRKADRMTLEPAVTLQIFAGMRRHVEDVYVHPDIERYIVALATATREHRQVTIGVSPRGSVALLKLARAWAAIHGRGYVLPDDVKQFATEALSHRVILEPSLWASRTSETAVIDEVVRSVAVPVIPGPDEQ